MEIQILRLIPLQYVSGNGYTWNVFKYQSATKTDVKNMLPESNLKNLTIDYIYRGKGVFVTQDDAANEYGFQNLSPLNLVNFADCSDYKIGDVFRINADFIHQRLREQWRLKSDRIIDKLYSIENVTLEYQQQ